MVMLLALLLSVAHAKSVSPAVQAYGELRDLQIFVRLPQATCRTPEALTSFVGGAAESQTQNLLAEFADAKLNADDRAFLKSKASACVRECSCAFLGDAFSRLKNEPRLKPMIASINKSASAMTDADYVACQKKQAVKCDRDAIRESLKSAKELVP